jgi:hypothetical protein
LTSSSPPLVSLGYQIFDGNTDFREHRHMPANERLEVGEAHGFAVETENRIKQVVQLVE